MEVVAVIAMAAVAIALLTIMVRSIIRASVIERWTLDEDDGEAVVESDEEIQHGDR